MNTFRSLLLSLLSLSFAGALPAAAISSNLASPVDPNLTEIVSGSNWIASSFGTGNSFSALTSVTIPIQADTAGSVQLDLYSNAVPSGGPSWGQPWTLLGTLQSPSSISLGSLQLVSFNGDGLSLALNSTYWLVLSAGSGAYEWAYASDSDGIGAGFQNTWAFSPDAGADWFSFHGTPMIMGVNAVATPEPTSTILIALGFGMLIAKRHRSKANQKKQNRISAGVDSCGY